MNHCLLLTKLTCIVSSESYLAINLGYSYFQAKLYFKMLFCQRRRTDHKNGIPSEAKRPGLVDYVYKQQKATRILVDRVDFWSKRTLFTISIIDVFLQS